MSYLPAILTLLLTATFVLSPLVTPPFAGFTADQLPIPQVDPPVQPAGYAFSIWGLIYVWLSVSALFGLFARGDDPDWDVPRIPLIVSLAVGTPWLWIATVSPVWATVTIFVMLLTAIAALTQSPSRDIWLFRVPVGLYAGWLTAAAFVSLGSTLAGYGIGLDQVGWAYACIAMALIVALAVQARMGDAPAYGLAVIWALVGIVVVNVPELPWVALTAAAGAAIVSADILRRA